MIYNILIFILSVIFIIISIKFNKYNTEEIKNILNKYYEKEKIENSNLHKYVKLFFTIQGALMPIIITVFFNQNILIFFKLFIIVIISTISLLFTIKFETFIINTTTTIYRYKIIIRNLETYLKYNLYTEIKEKISNFIAYLVDGISVLWELIISFSITFLIYKNYGNILSGIYDYLIIVLLLSIFEALRKVYIQLKYIDKKLEL